MILQKLLKLKIDRGGGDSARFELDKLLNAFLFEYFWKHSFQSEKVEIQSRSF